VLVGSDVQLAYDVSEPEARRAVAVDVESYAAETRSERT
jgi:hypothetical protein